MEKKSESKLIINPCKFHKVVHKLRKFFTRKGFIEVHTQNRLSILAACEDPETVSVYNYNGEVWPLPQTGQMWLEYEMLHDSTPPGYFCVSTSYRQEPNPVEGRHDLIFPMFEIEMKGSLEELIDIFTELLSFLGYSRSKNTFPTGNYNDVANEMGVKELEHEHEARLYEMYGPVFFLKNFPEHTSPFWNMSRYPSGNEYEGCSRKLDIILSGMETFGSAERSCDPDEMREKFHTIENGRYAKTIYGHFGKERTEKELDEFLSNKFMTRSGAGIGITRLIRSMEMEGLL